MPQEDARVVMERPEIVEAQRKQELEWNEQRQACWERYEQITERLMRVFRDEKALGAKQTEFHLKTVTDDYLKESFSGQSQAFCECVRRDVVNYASWVFRGKPDTRNATYQPRIPDPLVADKAPARSF